MIRIARPLHPVKTLGLDLERSLNTLDTTTIHLCLSLFPWASFWQGKAAFKMHTLLDLCGKILTFVADSSGKIHEVNLLNEIVPEPGALYVMDCGYLDFDCLYRFGEEGAFFVLPTRAKSCGTAVLYTLQSAFHYPEALRRLRSGTRKRADAWNFSLTTRLVRLDDCPYP